MKILFNQTSQINTFQPAKVRKKETPSVIGNGFSSDERILETGLSLASFPNISFEGKRGMNPDMKFLLSQAYNLRCAYSGKPMLMREEAETIYTRLAKRSSAHEAVNLLYHLKDFMHDVESSVFELLREAPKKKRCDFHDILQNYYDYSLEQLKLKQFDILNKANRIIKTLSEPVKEQVLSARDEALTNLGDAKLARCCLQKLKGIKAQGEDLEGVLNIFHTWYSLPCPSKDLDAFIVKYAPQSHEDIAKRLISSSVATIEHVQPSARNGADGLSNYILVSAQFNNSRSSMPLWEFMMLNSDINIKDNLQLYMDDVINLVNDKKSPFSKRAWYPEKIKETIAKETNNGVELSTAKLVLSKKQKREAQMFDKLCTVYKEKGKP